MRHECEWHAVDWFRSSIKMLVNKPNQMQKSPGGKKQDLRQSIWKERDSYTRRAAAKLTTS